MRARRLFPAPPRRAPRAALLPALLAGALAACADDSGPTSAPEPAHVVPTAVQPSLGLVNAAGTYWDGFNFLTSTSGAFGSPGGPPWPLHPPAPWRPTDFDVQIHSRDRATWYTPEAFRANHGVNCEPYQNAEPVNDIRPGDLGSHAVASYDDLNFRCRNHMMTAINATGYGVVYLTPNAMVDFSAGEASVKFALSTLRSSSRDWVDLWITPWADNLALPLDGSLVGTDLQGLPRTAVHVRMADDRTRSRFEGYVVNYHNEMRLPVLTSDGYERILLPVSTRRDTFELRISRYRVRFGMKKIASPNEPAGSITWIDVPVRLGFTRGVVQFGHHSMNPAYGGGSPGTWHWDDFTITPAVPFTIIVTEGPDGGRVRYVDAGTAATPVQFQRAAPPDAFLRFAAFGSGIQVSFDDGATWSDARRQRSTLDRADRFRSYWTPIPAGVSSVRFRQGGAAAGAWMVRDMTIWSLNP